MNGKLMTNSSMEELAKNYSFNDLKDAIVQDIPWVDEEILDPEAEAKNIWDRIKDIDDVLKVFGEDKLYDRSANKPSEIKIAAGLSPAEIVNAKKWIKFAKGLMLVTGPEGGGKTLFLVSTIFKMQRYFEKLSILDFKPRDDYGLYVPFDKNMLVNQMDRMKALQNFANNSLSKEEREDIWMSPLGRIFLKNCAMGLDEFHRYMPRENALLPISKALKNLMVVWRHLDIFLAGCTVKRSDIHPKAWKHLTAEVECTWDSIRKHTALCTIQPYRFYGSKGVLTKAGKPWHISINGARPRPELDGGCWYDLYNSWNCHGIDVSESLRKELTME